MTISIEQWQSTWNKLGLRAPAAHVFDAIMQAYSEPHRHYHTIRHLEECFSKLEELQAEAVHMGEIELALWFHDAIYDVKRHDNEEKSAAWACACLRQANAPEAITQHVGSLILATRHHEPTTDTDAQVLLDVDLAILGAPPERFQEYEQQIRDEYRHVPLPLFTHKRRQVLEGFLKRPRIFNTAAFFERYESLARRNIEIALLARDKSLIYSNRFQHLEPAGK